MRRVEEETKEEDTATPICDSDNDEEDPYPDGRWDDIGSEEMYLASTREELYELIMKEETYRCKVQETNMGVLMRRLRSLLKYGRQNIEELLLAQPEERKVNPKDQISRVSKMLADEFGTASNIKSRVNRLSVLGAITSVQHRLKLYTKGNYFIYVKFFLT